MNILIYEENFVFFFISVQHTHCSWAVQYTVLKKVTRGDILRRDAYSPANMAKQNTAAIAIKQ
jgi:hypothetical protein